MTSPKTFEVGKTYSERHICDHDSVATFTIVARTAKTVTVSHNGQTFRRGVTLWHDGSAESFAPFGRYSMAMQVRA